MVRQDDDGVTIALAKALREYMRPARVVSRTGAAVDEARNIRYTVQERDTGNVIENVYPSWGRPTRRDDVEIHAAEVGSVCWLVLVPDGVNLGGGATAKLWIGSGGSEGETLAFYECAQGVAAATRGMETRGGDVLTRDEGPGGPATGGGGTPSPTPAPPSGE